MVVGAGRGPLVRSSLNASRRSKIPVKVCSMIPFQVTGGVLTQKKPKKTSRYTKIGKLALVFFGFFCFFLVFLNFQIGIGFFWFFLVFFGFFWHWFWPEFEIGNWFFLVFFGFFWFFLA